MNFQWNLCFEKSRNQSESWNIVTSQLISNLQNPKQLRATITELVYILLRTDSKSSSRKSVLEKIKACLIWFDFEITSMKSQLADFEAEERANWHFMRTPLFVVINSKVVVLIHSNNQNILETLLSRALEFESWTMESNLILIWLENYLNINEY